MRAQSDRTKNARRCGSNRPIPGKTEPAPSRDRVSGRNTGFAFSFSVVGTIVNPVTGARVGGFDGAVISDSPGFYLGTALSTGLHLSVQTFTTVGSHPRPMGTAQYLVSLESLLGVGLIGLLWTSLIRS